MYDIKIDMEVCTGCGECEDVCPVLLNSNFDENLSDRHAIYKMFPQAIPNIYLYNLRVLKNHHKEYIKLPFLLSCAPFVDYQRSRVKKVSLLCIAPCTPW